MKQINQNLIFILENFILHCFDKNWPDLLQTDQQNVNLCMESFFSNINSILDVYAKLQKVNKYKLKFKTNRGPLLLLRNPFLLKTTY